MNEFVWVEKYKPRNISEYTFQGEDNKKFVTNIVDKGDLPNLMIGGIQGTGKSSLVQVLINELGIDRVDIKKFNASSENGIDNIRNSISSFCSRFPLGKYKVVILEEADGLTMQGQKALRGIMDDFSDSTRFIFTCNYPNKIISAIHSRCQDLYLNSFDEKELALHGAKILENESITFDPKILLNHVDMFKPDMRKFIQSLQQKSISGELLNPENFDSNELELWKMAWENPDFNVLVKMVSFVDENNFEEMFTIAYQNYDKLPEELQMRAYVLTPSYIERGYIVANQQVNLHGFLVDVFNLV